jgi:hypothetical protein
MALIVVDDAKIQQRLTARLERRPSLNGMVSTLSPLNSQLLRVTVPKK